MATNDTTTCSICGGSLKHHGTAKRKIFLGNKKRQEIIIHRYKCINCGKIHRDKIKGVKPYRRYTTKIINGFLNSTLTTDDLEFEDTPAEITIKRWKEKLAKN
jgi:uncharacterized Zn finger protein